MAEYTPETLRTLAENVRRTRMSALADIDEAGADPISEEYYRLALNAMDSAFGFLILAKLAQSKALAGG